MAETSGPRFDQIKPTTILGAGPKGQSCDGTFTLGNVPKYKIDGQLTDSGGTGGGPSGRFNVSFDWGTAPLGGTVEIGRFTFPEAVTFPANFSGSVGTVGTNPTSSQSWTLEKNGSSIGTVAISTGGVVTFSTSGAVSFSSTDVLTITGASLADATLANVNIVFAGVRDTVTSTPIGVVPFCYVGGPIPGSRILNIYTFPDPITFPANFVGSAGSCGTNPTSTATFTVLKNGSSVGTVVISTLGVFTFSTSGGAPVTFNAGDKMSATAPSSSDATLANMEFSLSGNGNGFLTAAVTSLNSLSGALSIVAGANITVTPSGSNITIAATLGARQTAIGYYLPGQPTVANCNAYFDVPSNLATFQLPANLVGALGKVGANPTATATVTFFKNASSIGTASISTSGVFTWATSGGTAVSFTPGTDELSWSLPTTDATLADVRFSIPVTVS